MGLTSLAHYPQPAFEELSVSQKSVFGKSWFFGKFLPTAVDLDQTLSDVIEALVNMN